MTLKTPDIDQIYQDHLFAIHHVCCEPYISPKMGNIRNAMAKYLVYILNSMHEFDNITKLLQSSIDFNLLLGPVKKITPQLPREVVGNPHEPPPPIVMDTKIENRAFENIDKSFYNADDLNMYLKSFGLGKLAITLSHKFIDIYDQIESKTLPTVIPLISRFNELGKIILYTGYMGGGGGHAICIYCNRITGDKIEIVLTNSGQGLLQHHYKKPKTDIFMGVVRNIITTDQFKHLLCAYKIFETQIMTDIEFFYTIMERFFKVKEEKITKHHRDISLRFLISDYTDNVFLRNIEYIPSQIAGTCTYFSVYYSLMYYCYQTDPSPILHKKLDSTIKNKSLKILMEGQMKIIQKDSKPLHYLNFYPYTIMLDKLIEEVGTQENKTLFTQYVDLLGKGYSEHTNQASEQIVPKLQTPAVVYPVTQLYRNKTNINDHIPFQITQTSIKPVIDSCFAYITKLLFNSKKALETDRFRDVTSGIYIVDTLKKTINFLSEKTRQ